MNSSFIFPDQFLIENLFDLNSISAEQNKDFTSSRFDLFLPTPSQMMEYCQESEKKNSDLIKIITEKKNKKNLDSAPLSAFSSLTKEEQEEYSQKRVQDIDIFPRDYRLTELPVYIPLYNHLRHYIPHIQVENELIIEKKYIVRKSLKHFDFSSFHDITSSCSYTFSSHKYNNGIDQLLDNDLSLYWQSDSNTAPHFISIDLPCSHSLAYLCIYIDCTADESYTPNEFVIKTGLTPHGYTTSELIQLAPPPTGWLIIPLQNFTKFLDEMKKYSIFDQFSGIIQSERRDINNIDDIINDNDSNGRSNGDGQDVNSGNSTGNTHSGGSNSGGNNQTTTSTNRSSSSNFLLNRPVTSPPIPLSQPHLDIPIPVNQSNQYNPRSHEMNPRLDQVNPFDPPNQQSIQPTAQSTRQWANTTTRQRSNIHSFGGPSNPSNHGNPNHFGNPSDDCNPHNTGYSRQFNSELPPIEPVTTHESFIPTLRERTTTTTMSTRPISTTTSSPTPIIPTATTTSSTIPAATTAIPIIPTATTSTFSPIELPQFDLISQQHRVPSFHMLIEILSSFQLGRDCRLRGLKLFAYKTRY